jgi:hypothetical protein
MVARGEDTKAMEADGIWGKAANITKAMGANSTNTCPQVGEGLRQKYFSPHLSSFPEQQALYGRGWCPRSLQGWSPKSLQGPPIRGFEWQDPRPTHQLQGVHAQAHSGQGQGPENPGHPRRERERSSVREREREIFCQGERERSMLRESEARERERSSVNSFQKGAKFGGSINKKYNPCWGKLASYKHLKSKQIDGKNNCPGGKVGEHPPAPKVTKMHGMVGEK